MFIFKCSNSFKLKLSPEQRKQLSSEQTITDALKNEPVIAFDIYNGNNPIAFALLRNCDKGFFLWDFAVDTKHQRKGYGTAVLKELIAILKDKYNPSWITTTYKYGNQAAEHLYTRVGFIQTDVIKNDSIHEVNMILHL